MDNSLINIHDLVDDDSGFVIIENKQNMLMLTISKTHNGDIDLGLSLNDAIKVANLLNETISTMQQK